MYVIPLTNDPNKTIKTTVAVGSKNVTLTLFFHYNEAASYWCMRVTDVDNNVLIDSLPLITGNYPSSDLLGQYKYLDIGGAYLLKASKSDLDYPDDNTLGDIFKLVWE